MKFATALAIGLVAAMPVAAQAQTISKAQWATRVDAICAVGNATEVGAPASDTLAQQITFTVKHASAELAWNVHYLKQVKAVPLPSTGKILAQTWLMLAGQQLAWSDKLIQAAKLGNTKAVLSDFGHETDRFNVRKPIGAALGLKVCGK